MIPIVRVANPADPTQFMTINAADYREVLHGPLWPEQPAGTPAPQPPRPQTRDPAVRDYAAALMLDVLDQRRAVEGLSLVGTLSPDQQILALRDARNEFEDSVMRYNRSRQVSDAEQRARDAVQVPEGVVPGETPGWPVDAVAGQPLALTDEQRAALAKEKLDTMEPARGNNPGEQVGQGQYAPGAEPLPETAPATPTPPANPWGGAAPEPQLTVEKGPGSKWYVMLGKEPQSNGFTSKSDAETAKKTLLAAKE